MEPKFQTSFIPKKSFSPIAAMSQNGLERHRSGKGTSLFMILAVIAFIASLGAVGGAYGWQQYLASQQTQLQNQLAQRENEFNLDLVEKLKQTNVQIDTAKSILANHLATSQIFDIIGSMTVEDVRFMSLDMTTPASVGDGIKISLNGFGTSYSAVAFQADVLGSLEQYGVRDLVKNPILSDPAQNSDGTVSFGFTATIDPKNLSYEASVAPSSASSATQSVGTTTIDSASASTTTP